MTTIIRADELHSVLKKWMPLNRHDDLAKCFVTEAPASNTPNLRPLPESEWPNAHKGKWHKGTKLFRISETHVLIRGGSSGMWMVNSHSDTPCFPDKHPTPQAALTAAGLPVELLDGLKRPTPAHENPRVVAAAVEIVKEVEKHTAKAAKDREDWLAQFPGWVREWCEIRPGAIPVRFLHRMAICFVQSEDRRQWVLIHQSRSVLSRWHPSLMEASRDASANLYADGNVPLWGDVFRYETDGGGWATAGRIDGSRVYSDKGYWWDASDLALLRRHPAIADLPGIVVENDLKVPGVNCPKPEYDPDDVAFKADKPDTESPDRSTDRPAPKLRVGQHVELVNATRADKRTSGYITGRHATSGRLVVCDMLGQIGFYPEYLLTPIPPPLIDNGDGEYQMDGYAMGVIQQIDDICVWRIDADGGSVWSSKTWDEPHDAAEDLWRRMEGIDR